MTRIKTLFARHGIAFLALFICLGGTATAATLINGKNIKKGTVTSKQVKDRSLLAKDFKRGQLPKGDTGATGAAGAAGATGAAAAKGDKGDTGAKGATGAAGATGAMGDTGASGSDGTDGAKGDQGDTGASGAGGAGLEVVDSNDVVLGALASVQPSVFTPADFSTNPPTPESRTPKLISFLTDDETLITVEAATGDFAVTDRVIYYESYSAPSGGNPAVCSGRAIVSNPRTDPQEPFALGTASQLYSWSGSEFAMSTEGVDGGQGCEQLGNAGNSGHLVTPLATLGNIAAPVRVVHGG